MNSEIPNIIGLQLDDVVNADDIKNLSNAEILDIMNCWFSEDKTHVEIKSRLVEKWIQENGGGETGENLISTLKSKIQDKRRQIIYNNIDRLKWVLKLQIEGNKEAEEIYKEFLENCEDIELVREELKGILKQCYDAEIESGGKPDPLQWQDYIGDVTK